MKESNFPFDTCATFCCSILGAYHTKEERMSKKHGIEVVVLQTVEEVERFHPSKISSTSEVRAGSLVQTNTGWFYVITSLGKLTSQSGDCFVISAASPIGQALLGKKVGETFRWNLQEGKILSIF
jgi:transcription elongation GreA/GreB family factor